MLSFQPDMGLAAVEYVRTFVFQEPFSNLPLNHHLRTVKNIVVLIGFLLTSLSGFAQLDSIKIQQKQVTLFDSLSNLADKQLITDSLTTISWRDSIHTKIVTRFNLDSISYLKKIDSLKHLQLPTTKYTQKLDSLISKKNNLVNEVQHKQNEFISKSKTQIETWKTKVGEKLGIKDLPSTNEVKLPQTDLPAVPDLNLPASSDIGIPTTGISDLQVPEIPQLSTPDFENIDLSPDLSKINESVSLDKIEGLGDVQEQLGAAGKAMEDVSALTTDTDKALESSVSKVAEVGAVKEELNAADELKNNEFMEKAEMMKDPEALQEQAEEQVIEKAVNHFAGKEAVLQQAMEKMAKYKQKYESLNSLSDIKKLPRNPMHGKPLIERLLPGVALQVLRKNDLFLDINPYLGYRITARFTSGIGWNQRIGYSLDHDRFTSASEVYGPRLFMEYRLWKGFSPRIEIEWMNTVVPPSVRRPITTDLSNREWVRSIFLGLKKEYRIVKNVKGTAFIMFNLYNPEHKSPYGDVLNTRFGFEFPLKRKSAGKKSVKEY